MDGNLPRADEKSVRERTLEVPRLVEGYRGFALVSGNSIANCVPSQSFPVMIETMREYRGYTQS